MEIDIIKAILLGIIQGLTEFLPISSSGHLVIFSKILDFQSPGITFEIFLHLGTLLAVILAFRKDLWQMLSALFATPNKRRQNPDLIESFKWNLYIIVATMPAVVVGLLLKENIDRIFNTILITYSMLALTGIIMILTNYLVDRGARLNYSNAFFIGVAQAMAIMPGLSRSGSTIFAGMFMGINRVTAARFSFILSIPAIFGAAVLDFKDMVSSSLSAPQILNVVCGTIASAVTGYLAILLLMKVIRKGKLNWFGYYCLCLAGLGFAHHFLT